MNPAQSHLLSLQRDDGGWGTASTSPSTTEATALSVLALSGTDDPDASRSARLGLAWLRERQRRDGSWPVSDQVPRSCWMTSLAVLALAGSPSDRPLALNGAGWILNQEGRPVPWFNRLFFFLFPKYDVIDLDLELKGWSWFEGTFGWVEPTAYALLALKRLREDLPESPTAYRVAEGERLLLDRVCKGGGWNYGNSRVYDEELWPYADTTALTLLALQDRPGLLEVRSGLQALDRMVARNGSLLATALAVLCRCVYGRPSEALKHRIMAHLGVESPWIDVRALALAGLALREDRPCLAIDHA